jgi:hypothetical protein
VNVKAAETFSNLVLPAVVNNEPEVQLRWLYFYESGSDARDRIRLDDITISSDPSGPPADEPSNHASNLSCGSPTTSSVDLNWDDATGGQLPTGYLILWSSTGFGDILDPMDGTPVANGAGALNVAQGVEMATITGLSQDTEYFFKVFPYTNSGANIDYKTDGTPAETFCSTLDGPCETEDFNAIIFGGSYGDYSFSKNAGTIIYSCIQGLRETPDIEDGFQRTIGGTGYAIRLRDAGVSTFQAKLTEGGMGQFTTFVRRWDANPDPVYAVEFSINNGSTWNFVQNLNNAWFGTSAYKMLSFGVFATSSSGDSSDDIIVRISRVTGERIMIDDVSWTCYEGCTPTQTIVNFTPLEGPERTLVTINGNGFTGVTDVKFGGVSTSAFTVLDDNTIHAEVEASSLSGRISVIADGCDRVSDQNFTKLTQNSNCTGIAGGAGASDLFISRVYDAPSGGLSYIEIFNGTDASVTLTNTYVIRIRTGTSTDTDYPMTGTLGVGQVYILRFGSSVGYTCDGIPISNNQPSAPGMNGNDQVFLRKNNNNLDNIPNPNSTSAGGTGADAPGFTQTRLNTVTSPTTTYNPAEWIISDQANCSGLGEPLYNPDGSEITISQHPNDVDCETEITLTVDANSTSGFPGTGAFTWHYHEPGNDQWQLVSSLNGSNGITVLGSNTPSITISGNTAILKDFQFYVDIGASGSPQCRKYSDVARYTYDTKIYYRSKAAGDWTDTDTWEMSDTEAGIYDPVCQYPIALTSDKILIRNNVNLDTDVDVDWMIIEPSYNLNMANNARLTIHNGNPLGADLEIEGTLTDNGVSGSGGVLFSDGGTWMIEPGANLVKTNTSSVVQYRDNYEGGMTAIPADANWTYRRVAPNDINLATIGMVYPNLTFENTITGIYEPFNTNYTFSGSSGTAIIKGNLNIGGNGPGNYFVRTNNTNSSPILVEGEFIIRSGCGFSNEHASTDNGTGIEVKGDIEINGLLDLSYASIGEDKGILLLSGIGDQNATGEFNLVLINKLIINKSAGKVISQFPMTVQSEGVFTSGILEFDNFLEENVLLEFGTEATTTGASNSSFVDGKVRKIGNTEFTFPIGDVNALGIPFYQPARVFDFSAPSTIDAQYFAEDATLTFPASITTGIGTCDHWVVEKPNSSDGDVKVALAYTNPDDDYCNEIGEPNQLRFSVYNSGMLWDEIPSNGDLVEVISDQRIGVAVGSAYGPFVLSSGSNLNVLPITLLSFTAQATGKNLVETHWSTASESNNDYFTIERSRDAAFWEPIGFVPGAGNSNTTRNYSLPDDAPFPGLSYYRLKQTDYDGSYAYSYVVPVQIDQFGADLSLIQAYRDGDKLALLYTAESPQIRVELYSIVGQKLHSINAENNDGFLRLDLPHLAHGVYIVRISSGTESATGKFFF